MVVVLVHQGKVIFELRVNSPFLPKNLKVSASIDLNNSPPKKSTLIFFYNCNSNVKKNYCFKMYSKQLLRGKTNKQNPASRYLPVL